MKTAGFKHVLVGLFLIINISAFGNSSIGLNKKITICHLPPGNPENVQTIEISENAWPAHEAHGDSMGTCDTSQDNDNSNNGKKITICHYPPGNPENVQTIEISENAWPAHEAHGDSQGNCEPNNQKDDPSPCEEGAVNGGEIAYYGPYNPDDDNIIYSEKPASSQLEGENIEYIWLQNSNYESNIINNPNWQVVGGSDNLEELVFAGLTETTYYVRCARIIGCSNDFFGKSNIIEVIVNSCLPEYITGGSISFDGLYEPENENIINSTALPQSSVPNAEFEYVWLQSEINAPNVEGNTNWNMVEGSKNLTELPVSGLTQTMYYIRCARIQGCDKYWGETNIVEVKLDDGSDDNCEAEVSAVFGEDNLSVTANSTKDLSNVVLKFCDETTEKIEELTGSSQTFTSEIFIVGIWIKSGCNQSDDGSGFGEYIENLNWDGSSCGDDDGDGDGDG
ncbi:hypothetical protein, partial [Fulvivirga lutimaris]|uniref:hypothetical protein n=1 Tax=Fulvivirga lutimaris TaxID=1819566 RepID=UPI001C8808CA